MEPKADTDPNKYFNLLYNLKQSKKSIAQYVAETEDLYRKCPKPLKDFMGSQFVAGLADDSKLDMIQLYLSNDPKITFPNAKAAVIKAYSRIERASPFDVLEDRSAGSKAEVSQNDVNAELLEFFRSLRMSQKHQPLVSIPQPSTNAIYSKNPQREAIAPVAPYPSYPKVGTHNVVCHNCLVSGHYSSNCPESQVNFKQKALNRAKVEEMASRMPQQAPAAAAAVAQFREENISPKGRILSHLPMTPAILQRGQTLQSLSRHPATAFTPKILIEETEDEETKPLRDGVAASANRVQKPLSKAAQQQPRRTAMKAAERLMAGPPGSRRLANRVKDITEEVEMPDRQAAESIPSTLIDDHTGPDSRIVRLPLPPSMRPQPTIEEVKDEQLPRRVQSPVNERIQPPPVIQFIDPPSPTRSKPQRKLPRQRAVIETYEPHPAPLQQRYDDPKKTVAINMAKNKSRFQISQFLDSPVTMPIWQLLDRSPQIRAQLARAMASSKSTRRGKKMRAAIALMAGKKALVVETEAHEEEEVVCLYICSWVGEVMIAKTLADTGAVIELINPKLVERLDLQIYEMDEEWTLQLADDGLAKVKQYVWVPVNVEGVVAVVRAFILGMGDIYDLLLSKRWIRRVRAIEDHGESTLIVRGKDGISRLIQGTETRLLNIELVDEPSIDEWETAMAEEEIAKLADELDGYDYLADQGKAERQ